MKYGRKVRLDKYEKTHWQKICQIGKKSVFSGFLGKSRVQKNSLLLIPDSAEPEMSDWKISCHQKFVLLTDIFSNNSHEVTT